MKKYLISLFLILPVFLSAYEHTGGARIDLGVKAPDINGTMAEATTTDSFSLWYKGSVNDLVNFNLEGALAYKGTAGFAVNLSQEFSYLGLDGDFYPNIKAANVYGSYENIYYRAGRQRMRDASGLVFAHQADGASGGILLGPGTLRAKLGYTGLVHYLASTVAMTRSDLTQRDGSSLGSPRLIEELGYSFPELLGSKMSMDVSFLAQQDLLDDSDVSAGSEKLNTIYSQLRLDGYLLPFLAYEGGFIYQMGNYGSVASNGTATELKLFFLPGYSSSLVSLSGLVSSGETWDNRSDYYGQGASGDQNQFMPISSGAGKGYVVNLTPGNLTSLELLINLSSSKKFATEISTTTLMRTVDGPVSSSLVVDNGVDDLFIGQEALLSFLFRPTSDFGGSFKMGALYPGECITINELLEDYLPVLFRVGFDLSFSF
jgi:hypothetical protein